MNMPYETITTSIHIDFVLFFYPHHIINSSHSGVIVLPLNYLFVVF